MWRVLLNLHALQCDYGTRARCDMWKPGGGQKSSHKQTVVLLGGLPTGKNQNLRQTLYILNQLPLKVKTFSCADVEIDEPYRKEKEQRGPSRTLNPQPQMNLKLPATCEVPSMRLCFLMPTLHSIPALQSDSFDSPYSLFSAFLSFFCLSNLYSVLWSENKVNRSPPVSPFSLSTIAACTSPSLSSPSSRSLTHV